MKFAVIPYALWLIFCTFKTYLDTYWCKTISTEYMYLHVKRKISFTTYGKWVELLIYCPNMVIGQPTWRGSLSLFVVFLMNYYNGYWRESLFLLVLHRKVALSNNRDQVQAIPHINAAIGGSNVISLTQKIVNF